MAISKEKSLELYRNMVRYRKVTDTIFELYRQSDGKGNFAAGEGEEAIQVGIGPEAPPVDQQNAHAASGKDHHVPHVVRAKAVIVDGGAPIGMLTAGDVLDRVARIFLGEEAPISR